MKIHSTTSLITNSSSEVFVYQGSEADAPELLEDILQIWANEVLDGNLPPRDTYSYWEDDSMIRALALGIVHSRDVGKRYLDSHPVRQDYEVWTADPIPGRWVITAGDNGYFFPPYLREWFRNNAHKYGFERFGRDE